MKDDVLSLLSSKQKHLRKKLLTKLYTLGLSHIGSCLNSIDIIHAIYQFKDKQDRFVLSNGHAGYALYTVLEDHGLVTSESNNFHDIHPLRAESQYIDASTGSLGQGLPIAVGMALAKPMQMVYCTISDGEISEGSIWESFRFIIDSKIKNIQIFLTANGWSAYDGVDAEVLYKRIRGFGMPITRCNGHDSKKLDSLLKKYSKSTRLFFCDTTSDQFLFLKGLDAHYHKMSKTEFESAIMELQ